MSFRAVLVLSGLLLPAVGLSQTIQTFNFTGAEQTWVVPPGVNEVDIELMGGEGAAALDRREDLGGSGLGSQLVGTLQVTPGETLYLYVGGMGSNTGTGGFNGGGAGGNGQAGSGCSGGPAGGGGGASDIRQGGNTLADRVAVAGGGGGGGRDYCNGTCQPCGCGGAGGSAGDILGLDGDPAFNCGFAYAGSGINFGSGGSDTTGGLGGPQDGGATNVGTAGAIGVGGTGSNGLYDVAGGGGGGGYFGGGGGGGASNGSGVGGGGGGGGSSYSGGLLTGTVTPDINLGDGQIVLSFMVNAAPGAPPVAPTEVIPTLSMAGLLALILSLVFLGYRGFGRPD